MDENTNPVVEDNNQPAPTDETTLTEQTSEAEVEQPEQAADESTPVETESEPSESPTEVEQASEVKRLPRVERRFDQFSKKLAEANQRVQPQAANYLPRDMPSIEPGREYSAEDLDQILSAKAQAISLASNAQLVNQLQVRDTVQNYVNSVTEDTAELRKHELLDPSLNPNAEKLEEKIGILYERANPIEKNGQFNPDFDPNYRLKDFALDYLEEVGSYRTKGQVESTQSLQAAADSAALPPSGTLPSAPDDSADALKEKLANFKF